MSTRHTIQDFETHHAPTWCPGCGDFGIWTALKKALVDLRLPPHRLVVVFGIGCSGNQSNFVRAYGFHGLHGRALPIGEGVALANHGLTTIVVSGDGDGYGEGMAHFIHTIRANPNITYLVHDNQVYGLTKGQTAPTSPRGFVSPSTPQGSVDDPVNPIALAIAAGCGFVARGFAGDIPHLSGLIVSAVKHQGFSLVDILQPCVSFNHLNTYAWYYQRLEKLETINHDPTDQLAAWTQAQRGVDKMPIGIFYRPQPLKPTQRENIPVLSTVPLVKQPAHRRNLKPLLRTMR